jgi:valyl-tRNA synthetase
VPVIVRTEDPAVEEALRANEPEIRVLARVSTLAVGAGEKPHPAIAGVAVGSTVYVPLTGIVDLERERERLGRGLEEVERERGRLSARLADARFIERAPANVVADTQMRLSELVGRADRLRARIADLA